MPTRGERIEPTHEWHQLAFRIRADGQRTYELIRPHPRAGTRLFGHSPAERAAETGAAERLFETPHRSPQPPLWAWGEAEWLRVLRLPAYAPRKTPVPVARQPPLFLLEVLE